MDLDEAQRQSDAFLEYLRMGTSCRSNSGDVQEQDDQKDQVPDEIAHPVRMDEKKSRDEKSDPGKSSEISEQISLKGDGHAADGDK